MCVQPTTPVYFFSMSFKTELNVLKPPTWGMMKMQRPTIYKLAVKVGTTT